MSRLSDAITAYAAANASDPFAAARAYTHSRNGIGYEDGRMMPSNFCYTAEAIDVVKSMVKDGQRIEYAATEYRNVKRA